MSYVAALKGTPVVCLLGREQRAGRATLADLTVDNWLGRRDDMGHLLESFVVQQIQVQAAWTDPDLRFLHYRDNDQGKELDPSAALVRQAFPRRLHPV